MTVREFVAVLRRRWMSVVCGILLAIAAAAAVTLTTAPVYTATARVYLYVDNTNRTANDNQQQVALGSGDLQTYVAVLDSAEDIINPLRKTLNLRDDQWLSLSGKVTETGTLIDLTAEAGSGQVAAAAANALGPQMAKVADKYSPLLQLNGEVVTSSAVKPALVPSGPTTPNPRRNLALGGFAGLLLGIGLAFVRHLSDTKVRNDDDVHAETHVPILARVPLDKQGKRGELAMRDDPHGQRAESIRRLRTNLLFVDVTTAQHSAVVTSPLPGEGKTTTTVNLALAMASAGARVLLIDGDLRNPSIGKAMGLDEAVGLTNVLLGRIDVDDALQQWPDTSLDILTAGQIPPNPSELLGSTPMELLFHTLRPRYDFVLIDSPPIIPVVDATILAKLTGNLLMIVAADRTKKRDVHAAVRILESAGTPAAGVALNMVSGDLAERYRYGYHTANTEAATLPETRRAVKNLR